MTSGDVKTHPDLSARRKAESQAPHPCKQHRKKHGCARCYDGSYRLLYPVSELRWDNLLPLSHVPPVFLSLHILGQQHYL